MNWFERHLNWTMVLAWLGTLPVAFIAGFIIAMVMVSADPYVSEEALDGAGFVTGVIIALVILIPSWGWVLKKKNRSLWWLLLGLFVPLGWIVLLCLENRRHISGLQTPELQG